MASVIYNEGAHQLLTAGVDWSGDTIKIMLVDSSYVPDKDEDDVSTAAADEIVVTGYQEGFAGTGRKTLGSKTLTKDDSNDRVVFDAADPSAWTLNSGVTVGGALIYWHDTNDAGSVPLFFIDFTDTPTNGGTFTVQFHANGIAYLQE